MCVRAQPILKRSGGTKAVNGPPHWVLKSTVIIDASTPVPTSWKAVDVRSMAYINMTSKDGCCWTAAGLKAGYYSINDQTYTFKLKCITCVAYGGHGALKVKVDCNLNQERIYEAEGWEHKHDGDLLRKRGLPPQVRGPTEPRPIRPAHTCPAHQVALCYRQLAPPGC